MANRRLEWDRQALRQFNKAILYIAEDSIQNAEKVQADILEDIDAVIPHPERYPLDKFKIDNDGSYRAFELHRLRVAYFVGIDFIRILRIRHTSREPQVY
ncbi:MAG TPA: type II toxin-antitoxin system RelE/ParE family toxin [Puia sp.]|jgi:plasmid stabilization system protein ParE|nr:type II toxin-antitoxin system RelE/ParE family toxin [Puia sp.]